MSTINAQNYGDGTDSVPASRIIFGTISAKSLHSDAGFIGSAEYNAASITNIGTGRNEVNFSNVMASGSYSGSVSANGGQTTQAEFGTAGITANYAPTFGLNSGVLADRIILMTVNGDLA